VTTKPASGPAAPRPAVAAGRGPAIGAGCTPQASDGRQIWRYWKEIRRGRVDLIPPGGEIVTQLVDQQDAEERQGKRPAGDEILPARACRRSKKRAPPMMTPTSPGGSVGVQLPPARPRAQGTDHGEREQHQVKQPSFGSPRAQHPDEHQVRVLGIGPIMAAGPGGERLCQAATAPDARGATNASVYSRRPSAWVRQASHVALSASTFPLDALSNAV